MVKIYIIDIYKNHDELIESMNDYALKGFQETVLKILKQCLDGEVKSCNGTVWLDCFYCIRAVVKGFAECFNYDIKKIKKAIINSFEINFKCYKP